MSLVKIRSLFETQMQTVTPDIQTFYENVASIPTDISTPFQFLKFIPTKPINPEMGPYYIAGGIFQVNLYYPKNAGTGDIVEQAETIRSNFNRGVTLIQDDVVVIVSNTPNISQIFDNGGQFISCIIEIPWHSHFGGS